MSSGKAAGGVPRESRGARARETTYGIYRRWSKKHLSFFRVLDIYGFRIIVHAVPDCYLAMAPCTAVQAGAGQVQG